MAGPNRSRRLSWVERKLRRKRNLQQRIRDTISVPGETWGIFAQGLHTQEVLFEHNADQVSYAASVNKLLIVVATLSQPWVDLARPFEVKIEYKRPGTGILRYFPEGWELNLEQVLALMLIVSDNTAAQMAVANLGLEKVNRTIRSLGMRVSGLEPIDGGFTYGQTTPREMSELLANLGSINMLLPYSLHRWMRQNRFPYGIRRGVEGFPWGALMAEKLSHRLLKVLSKTKFKPGLNWYLNQVLSSKPSKSVANKEGSLDDVRNEVAVVLWPRPYVLAIFSSGLADTRYSPRNTGVLKIAEVAKLVHKLAKDWA